jgi:hypothetical protein
MNTGVDFVITNQKRDWNADPAHIDHVAIKNTGWALNNRGQSGFVCYSTEGRNPLFRIGSGEKVLYFWDKALRREIPISLDALISACNSL